MIFLMPKSSSPSDLSDGKEFIVNRETFDQFFDVPLPTSTFHDLVKKGKIKRWDLMKGRFYLNESLRRMGLPKVSTLPGQQERASLEDISRLAFTLIDPLLFPAPPWLLRSTSIPIADAELARRMYLEYLDTVEGMENDHLKLAYFAGVLDAQAMTDAK